MSEGTRWLDGFAVAARILGLGAGEIAGALPEGAPPPRWLDALERAPTREARAELLAAQVARLRAAVRTTRPGWR